MRSAWPRMRFEEFVPRRLVAPRRALQGLNEARERGQGCAQFMAGIGDKIRAHALDLLFARQILEHEKNGGAFGLLGSDRRNIDFEMPCKRPPHFVVHAQRSRPARSRG